MTKLWPPNLPQTVSQPAPCPDNSPEPQTPSAPEVLESTGVTAATSDQQIKSRLARFTRHHRLAGKASDQAFTHTVIAAIEVVALKAETGFGKYTKEVRTVFRGVAERSIRRYRQIGEQFLSVAHGGIITAGKLRRDRVALKPGCCTDEFVFEYLKEHNLTTREQLMDHAKTAVPQPAKPAKTPLSPPFQLLKMVERGLDKMNQKDRNQAWQGLDALREIYPPMKEVFEDGNRCTPESDNTDEEAQTPN